MALLESANYKSILPEQESTMRGMKLSSGFCRWKRKTVHFMKQTGVIPGSLRAFLKTEQCETTTAKRV